MNKIELIQDIIAKRRTIKPEQCTGEQIPNEKIWQILECANWAPTHGYTEPWRFYVYAGEQKKRIATDHANLYKKHTPPEKFKQVSYNKLMNRADLTSHIIIYANKRGDNPKIPAIEEIQSTAMAVQNMQLCAHAMGYAAYIHSGGMTFHPALKDYLGLSKEDQVLGFLYIGVPQEELVLKGRRITPIQEKVKWL